MTKNFPITIELVGPGGRLSTATVYGPVELANELEYLSDWVRPGDVIRFLSEEDED
jgi:hypothetical protein